MAKLFLILSTLFLSHEVLSQIIRQPENLLNRNLIEALLESTHLESPRYIPQIDPFIQNTIANSPSIPDYPINIPSPVLNIPSPVLNIPSPVLNIPSPTNIPNSYPYPLLSNTNSPDSSVCKNLANTIQLMVLSDLLKTREADDIALRLAAPVLSNIITIPRASIRSPGLGTNLINTLSLAPNGISNVIPSVTNSPRIVISPSSPNIMSSVSDGRIERGMLTNMLKYLGGAL